MSALDKLLLNTAKALEEGRITDEGATLLVDIALQSWVPELDIFMPIEIHGKVVEISPSMYMEMN